MAICPKRGALHHTTSVVIKQRGGSVFPWFRDKLLSTYYNAGSRRSLPTQFRWCIDALKLQQMSFLIQRVSADPIVLDLVSPTRLTDRVPVCFCVMWLYRAALFADDFRNAKDLAAHLRWVALVSVHWSLLTMPRNKSYVGRIFRCLPVV